MKGKIVVVFDLDDTLIREIDYLKSAYLEIANYLNGGKQLYNTMLNDYLNGKDVFDILVQENTGITLEFLLNMYRNHFPHELAMDKEVVSMLGRISENGALLGIITDGRSVTQRNKLTATGVLDLFDEIVISEEFGSEKPAPKNYELFHKYKAGKYYYIGDNTKKDFITPNELGWETICLIDSGHNIHKQNFNFYEKHLPKYVIQNLIDVERYLDFKST